MKLRLPHTFSIIAAIILIVGIMTWILPAGEFNRVLDEKTNRLLVVPGTYEEINGQPQGIVDIFSSFGKGIIDAAEIIAYILLVGGVYGVLMKTGAIDSGIKRVITLLRGRTNFLIIIIMFLFSLGGTTAGIWEETLPFYGIIVPLMVVAGYDPLVGVAVLIIGAGTGVLASTTNPFATGIASEIAQTTILDGYTPRLITYIITVAVSIMYVLWYANRIKKDPTKSLMAKQKEEYLKVFTNKEDSYENTFDYRKKIIVFSFFAMLGFVMYSLIELGWSVINLTILYFGVAIIAALITKMDEKTFWDSFVKGSKDMLSAALIIGMARGIIVVANDGKILDTILYYCANFLNGFSDASFLIVNQLVQMLIAFFVPSSSAHAALTMSVMAPLADLFHIQRYAVVTTYQAASGLINLITPTAGVLMGALVMGRVPWGTWLKFTVPLVVVQTIITLTVLIISLN